VAYLGAIQGSLLRHSPPCPCAEDKQLQNARIISIIDDDESVRSSLRSLVRSLGFDACTFSSAEEFLRSSHVNKTCCLITDLQMPGLNGVELQQLLLAQGQHMPIIFVTAFAEERIQARAMDLGALGFLSKPFDCQALVKLISGALEMGLATC
jgi:FixJ family two-component response regulator